MLFTHTKMFIVSSFHIKLNSIGRSVCKMSWAGKHKRDRFRIIFESGILWYLWSRNIFVTIEERVEYWGQLPSCTRKKPGMNWFRRDLRIFIWLFYLWVRADIRFLAMFESLPSWSQNLTLVQVKWGFTVSQLSVQYL